MGIYNTADVPLVCPRCHAEIEAEVYLHFGLCANFQKVRLGEQYPFMRGRRPQNGGPLPAEQSWGLGYVVCPACEKDFHCLAEIRDEKLTAVVPDLENPPFMADRELPGVIDCPACGSHKTRFQIFDGYQVGRLLCDESTCHHICLVRHDDAGLPLEVDYHPQRVGIIASTNT
ncbi:hypothetical protein Pan153_49720 [Gimesia panareensis]|uniref:Uncharacterized protein n=1 Tax=Gimesia panareensis TaxID=2527978 RepID=A0A518FVC0_9PLAN|nr:hypothetical protein [Gimesia panareensis]QDV20297.1 hypothetical protein Pan153_49720 [Gimesia panareensis]